jgi:hypothetical protein
MTINRFYLFLTLLVIAISGNPAVEYFNKEAVIILPAIVMLGLAIYKRVKVTRRDFIVLAFFSSIYLVHLIEFGSITLSSSFGMLFRLLTALMAVRVIPDFAAKYVTVMYGLAIMSLVFFIPNWLGMDLPSLLAPISIPLRPGDINIGLHNFTPEYDESLIRNRGFFWEPGAFAGYLILALLFTLKDVEKVPWRYFFILIVALLSTQSTTGYLAFLVVAPTIYIIRAAKRSSLGGRFVAAFAVVIFALIAAAAFNNLPFLKSKITEQFEEAHTGEGKYYLGRYGNLLYDLNYIVDRPIFGWSSLSKTRQINAEEITRQGNGLSGYTVKYGLVGIFGFLVFSFTALSKLYGNKKFAAVAIFTIMILLNGEQFLNFSMFLSLMFIPQGKLRPLTASYKMDVRKLGFAGRGAGKGV